MTDYSSSVFPDPLPPRARNSHPAEPHVVTSGQGVVQAVPDRAWVTIGAESRASSAREAQRLNTVAMTPIIGQVESSGCPRRRHQDDRLRRAVRVGLRQQQTRWPNGYVARNTVEVRIDAIDRVGELLEIAGASGRPRSGGSAST